MKKLLWISRHEMTQQQYSDLERIIGEPIAMTQHGDTVQRVEELQQMIEEADWIAAVLPMPLLAEVLKLAGDKPVVQAVSKRIPIGRRTLPDGTDEPEFAFVHAYWQQVLRLDYEVQRL